MRQISEKNQESKMLPRKWNKSRLILFTSFLCFVLAVVVVMVYMREKPLLQPEANQKELLIEDAAPDDLLMKAFVESEEEQPEVDSASVDNQKDAKKIEPSETEKAEAVYDNNVEQKSIQLTDITVFGNEKAIIQCYELGAQSYHWEIYSDIDQQWMKADKKSGIEIKLLKDQLGKEISNLTIQEELESNIKIRCTVKFPDKNEVVSECEVSRYQDDERIKAVSIPELEANIDIVSSLELPAIIENESGNKIEVTGIQSLVFCLEQEEESSRVYDENSSLTIDTHTKTYYETKSYPVKSGSQKVQLRCSIMEQEFELQTTITGVDQSAPEIQTVQAEYVVSDIDQKVPVSITATVTDNIDEVADLKFAFAYEKNSEKKLNWTKEIPIVQEVEKNGLYYFYAKDTAGNITKKEIEITAVDMKAPIIDKADLQKENHQSYTMNVLARDKTKLEYCLYEDVNKVEKWQDSSTFSITKNGEYILKVKDAAGNETIYPGQINISDLDDAAPIILGIEEVEQMEKEKIE